MLRISSTEENKLSVILYFEITRLRFISFNSIFLLCLIFPENERQTKQIGRGLFYLPTIFFLPEEASARALMTFPKVLSDWLMAEPSFSLSPVAPVESALSLKYYKDIKYIRVLFSWLSPK